MSWQPVCDRDALLPERGIAVLLDGIQVALVATFDGELHAVGNIDPYTGAGVMSRGIVGTRGDQATIASPLHKQVFSLRTGACLDEPEIRVPVYQARVNDGRVEISLEPTASCE